MPAYSHASLPHRTSFRSLPPSPYALERSLVPRDMEESLAMQHARLDLGGDYFSSVTSPGYEMACGSRQSGSPCKRCERDCGEGIFCGISVQEAVRRQNLAAALANSQIPPRSSYAQIHPMMTSERRYPTDFSLPMTMNSFRSLEAPQLDRILTAYRLPLDLHLHQHSHNHHQNRHPNHHTSSPCSSCSTSRRNPSPLSLTLSSSASCRECESCAWNGDAHRAAKNMALLEFLGAAQVLDLERERARKEGKEALRERERGW